MVWNKLKIYCELVAFRHTLFALPFALTGAYLAAKGWPALPVFFWILVAMAGARNAAMAVNRLVDYKIDAKNPRTSARPLVRGAVSKRETLLLGIFGFLLLVVAAWQLNPLCLYLSPFAVLFVSGYSYTKRFTWGCHLVLGLSIGLAPAASWLAVKGNLAFAPVVLMLAVAFWVSGFDIIYAMQDAEFDRRFGLHAIPARFGLLKSRVTAAFLHLMAFIMLLLLPVVYGWEEGSVLFNNYYFLGVLLVGAVFVWQHRLVSTQDLKGAAAAFKVNESIGVIILFFTVIGTTF